MKRDVGRQRSLAIVVRRKRHLLNRFTYSQLVCVGAKSAAATGALYLTIQPNMSTVASAYRSLTALQNYFAVSDGIDAENKTLALVYNERETESQLEFERLFWRHIQTLHDIDGLFTDYDPTVSQDPASPDFQLSLAGRAVFTVTLNNHGPRRARTFPFATLVVNQIVQFNELKKRGLFNKWQDAIRGYDADIDPSGVANPMMLETAGNTTAYQIAGSALEPCPFKPRVTLTAPNEARPT